MKTFVKILRMDRIYQLSDNLSVEGRIELDCALALPHFDQLSKATHLINHDSMEARQLLDYSHEYLQKPFQIGCGR